MDTRKLTSDEWDHKSLGRAALQAAITSVRARTQRGGMAGPVLANVLRVYASLLDAAWAYDAPRGIGATGPTAHVRAQRALDVLEQCDLQSYRGPLRRVDHILQVLARCEEDDMEIYPEIPGVIHEVERLDYAHASSDCARLHYQDALAGVLQECDCDCAVCHEALADLDLSFGQADED